MTLSIIYINYNTRGLLKQSLKHLFLMAPALDFEVIVVDNNSSDGSVEMIQKRFPQVRIIESKENLGYSKGANLGIKNCNGKYVAIFNPDIFIMKGSLEAMVNFLDNNISVGAVGPKLENADKTLQYSCYKFPKIYTPLLRRSFFGETAPGRKELNRYLMKKWSHSESREVDWLLGGALVARKSALVDVGYFDERYFLYFEDTDLGKKLKKRGYKVIYLPSAKMVHLHRRESADTTFFKSIFNKTTRIHIASAIKYFLKWGLAE
ncbi:MAG: glycosyltransferase family 2 protein [Patescibacteria group bacterium]